MSDLTRLTIGELAEKLQTRDCSSVEVTRAYLDRIARLDGDLGSYLHIMEEDALAQAAAADARIAAGDAGPLTGVPLAIKDVLCLTGHPTTCGSKILENFRPPFDGTAVARLRAAGAVFLGKTNCDEFAMGTSNEYSAYKIVRNPWDRERIPGGSSGGSAVAVAARLAAGSLGTDTGGSVRQPAAMCGLVGLKPTYGRVSRYGLVAFGSSLDTIGPFARCVRDAAIILEAMAGHDERDSTTLPAPVGNYFENLEKGVKGLCIGVPDVVDGDGIAPDVREKFSQALTVLEQLGAQVKRISLPLFHYAIPVYYVVACAEASSNLARFDGIRYGLRVPEYQGLLDQYLRTRTAGFGAEVKRRIMLGTFVLSSGYYDAYYRKGTQVRTLITRDVRRVFGEVDLIATPTAPSPAFRLGEKVDDPVQMYLEDIFTVTANLAGVPGISINCGFSRDRLPIGFQFFAPHLREDMALRGARALEAALGLDNAGPIE